MEKDNKPEKSAEHDQCSGSTAASAAAAVAKTQDGNISDGEEDANNEESDEPIGTLTWKEFFGKYVAA